MSKISVNVSAVYNAGTTIQECERCVSSVRAVVNSTRSQIDAQILNTNGLNGRFENLSNKLKKIDEQLISIKKTVENCVSRYEKADRTVASRTI